MGSNVISLARARRRLAHRLGRRQFHPVANHLAVVIPFPAQIRAETLARHAGRALNRRTVIRGKGPDA